MLSASRLGESYPATSLHVLSIIQLDVVAQQGSAEEAARKADRQYLELSDRSERGQPGRTSLSRFIERFRREEVSQLAESSQRSYNATLDALNVFFVERGRDPKLRKLGRGDVKRFLAWRRTHDSKGRERETQLADKTLQTEYSIFRRMLGHAFDLELIDGNPAARVAAPKVENREPVLLSDEQLEQLLAECEGDDMLRLYVLLLAETGVRSRSEALHVRWEHVDLEDVPSGQDGHKTKSRKGRYVPLTARMRRAFREHAAKYRLKTYSGERSPWVFHRVSPHNRWGEPGGRRKSFKTALKSAVDDADLPEEWRLHDLRHRRCTRWLAGGHSPALVRKAMGHADLATTLKYEHLVKRDLRSMVEEEEKEALAEMGV